MNEKKPEPDGSTVEHDTDTLIRWGCAVTGECIIKGECSCGFTVSYRVDGGVALGWKRDVQELMKQHERGVL